jgi:hypothetical protein
MESASVGDAQAAHFVVKRSGKVAVAQVVSRWFPTAAAWVRAQGKSWDLWWPERLWGTFPLSIYASH